MPLHISLARYVPAMALGAAAFSCASAQPSAEHVQEPRAAAPKGSSTAGAEPALPTLRLCKSLPRQRLAGVDVPNVIARAWQATPGGKHIDSVTLELGTETVFGEMAQQQLGIPGSAEGTATWRVNWSVDTEPDLAGFLAKGRKSDRIYGYTFAYIDGELWRAIPPPTAQTLNCYFDAQPSWHTFQAAFGLATPAPLAPMLDLYLDQPAQRILLAIDADGPSLLVVNDDVKDRVERASQRLAALVGFTKSKRSDAEHAYYVRRITCETWKLSSWHGFELEWSKSCTVAENLSKDR